MQGPRPSPEAPQREVVDAGRLRWSCVQAHRGIESELTEAAADLATDDNGMVPVVCKPGEGAQCVCVELPPSWAQDLPDVELLAAIARARRLR